MNQPGSYSQAIHDSADLTGSSSSVMSLLILDLVFVVVLLLYTPEPVHSAAVKYYVTPSEPPNPDCSIGEPCETLDHYASNTTGYFAGKDSVTMIFLSGNHTSKSCFNFSCPHVEPCLNLTMLSLVNSTEIQLGCDFILSSVNVLTMSSLTIHGNEKYGIILREAPFVGMTVDGVTFVGAALRLGGHLSSNIMLSNTYFEASVVEMNFTSPEQVNIEIFQTTFATGLNQNNVISMCIDDGSASLTGRYISTVRQSAIKLNAPQLQYCGRNSKIAADILVNSTSRRLDTEIMYSTFSRAYGMAVYYQLQLDMNFVNSYLNADFNHSVFKHYDHGAIALKFVSVAVKINIRLLRCHFENNTFPNSSKNGASGVQIIYPLHRQNISNINHTIRFSGCHFRHNTGQVVLLYKSKSVTFEYCRFEENNGSGIVAFHVSHLAFSHHMLFLNNRAYRGAGLVLIATTLHIETETCITFCGNMASNKGGAIFVEGRPVTDGDNPTTKEHCFYQISEDGIQSLNFTSNFAKLGGHDIYGSPLSSYCLINDHQIRSYQKLSPESDMFHFEPPNTLSPITSDPQRVCLCNSSGIPRCDEMDSIFFSNSDSLYPGEAFPLSLVVVGIEFGTVAGVVQTNLVQQNGRVLPDFHQVLNVSRCTELNFTILHCPSQVKMYLTIEDRYAPYYDEEIINQSIQDYHGYPNIIPTELLTVPVFIDITLLPCPPGFMLIGKSPKCDCYPQIAKFITCKILNHTGFVTRNNTVWIGIDNDTSEGALFSKFCPFEYCNVDEVVVDLSDPDIQCAFNHAGRLCGGCMEGYSLAIGSTHCLHCPNSSYFALVLFFIFAGFALVLLIHILNLTITQGTINGTILYANIVWTYEQVLFPRRGMVILPFRILLAWLNLDFGIETCFVEGLSAFWSSWLQFIFPLYIWSIAGVIIVVCRCSTRLTKMFGDRAVPLLATLFLMSYLKLLRTVVDICLYTTLTEYPTESKIVVWYLDGNLLYGHYPHIFLLLVAIATLILVSMPYTLVIFSIQWLRRVSHLRVLQWISNFSPIFDAHLAPLKDKHHYWFGTLLILRGILLIIFTLTSANHPEMNLLVLFITTMALFFYMFYFQFYKSKLILLLEGLSFMNLTLVAGCSLYVGAVHGNQSALINVSISIMVVQFFAVIVWHCVKTCCLKTVQRRGYLNIETVPSDVSTKRVNTKPDEFDETDELRDSVLISNTY